MIIRSVIYHRVSVFGASQSVGCVECSDDAPSADKTPQGDLNQRCVIDLNDQVSLAAYDSRAIDCPWHPLTQKE